MQAERKSGLQKGVEVIVGILAVPKDKDGIWVIFQGTADGLIIGSILTTSLVPPDVKIQSIGLGLILTRVITHSMPSKKVS